MFVLEIQQIDSTKSSRFKPQILNSVGEDEDLPDLHDEEDERIHLTPNGIVPRLFVWKMLEKHTRLKRIDCKKVEKV